jgi:hypothetical protein
MAEKSAVGWSNVGFVAYVMSVALVLMFAVISAWVVQKHQLPSTMAALWVGIGPAALLVGPLSVVWGFGKQRNSSAAYLAIFVGLGAPAWFYYGIVQATSGP